MYEGCSISTSYVERSDRPKEVTSQEMIDKIHDIVLNDRRLKVREISETVNISVGNFSIILIDDLQKGIVYYVLRRIMRVITRRATMLAGDRSRGVISPASILSEPRNYPNCVHWHIFYFMWLRRIHEFLCVQLNPIWKGRNCRDYRPSHLTFREYFRPFLFSRSCVVVSRSVL